MTPFLRRVMAIRQAEQNEAFERSFPPRPVEPPRGKRRGARLEPKPLTLQERIARDVAHAKAELERRGIPL